MNRRDELQLFSTSFIDLMACALAGAAILWILTLKAKPVEEQSKSHRAVMVRLAQNRTFHLDGLSVLLDGPRMSGAWKLSDFAANSTRLTPSGTSVTLKRAARGRAYGGSLTLLIEKLSEALELRLAFSACPARSLHDIHLEVFDASGVTKQAAFFSGECNLRHGIGMPAIPGCKVRNFNTGRKRLVGLHARLAGLGGAGSPPTPIQVLDPKAADPTWTVSITPDGRVELTMPPAWDEAQTWLRAELAGLS